MRMLLFFLDRFQRVCPHLQLKKGDTFLSVSPVSTEFYGHTVPNIAVTHTAKYINIYINI